MKYEHFRRIISLFSRVLVKRNCLMAALFFYELLFIWYELVCTWLQWNLSDLHVKHAYVSLVKRYVLAYQNG